MSSVVEEVVIEQENVSKEDKKVEIVSEEKTSADEEGTESLEESLEEKQVDDVEQVEKDAAPVGEPDELLQKGLVLAAQGQYEDAIEHLGHALEGQTKAIGTELAATLAPFHFAYANVLLTGQEESTEFTNGAAEGEDDDLEVAWECFEMARKCFELEEDQVKKVTGLKKVHTRLGDLLMEQQNFPSAVEEFEKALAYTREIPDVDLKSLVGAQYQCIVAISHSSKAADAADLITECTNNVTKLMLIPDLTEEDKKVYADLTDALAVFTEACQQDPALDEEARKFLQNEFLKQDRTQKGAPVTELAFDKPDLTKNTEVKQLGVIRRREGEETVGKKRRVDLSKVQ